MVGYVDVERMCSGGWRFWRLRIGTENLEARSCVAMPMQNSSSSQIPLPSYRGTCPSCSSLAPYTAKSAKVGFASDVCKEFDIKDVKFQKIGLFQIAETARSTVNYVYI